MVKKLKNGFEILEGKEYLEGGLLYLVHFTY